MADPYEIIEIEPKDIMPKALEHKEAGDRLGQICCVRTEGGYDLLYSYIFEYRMINYKIPVALEQEIDSIEPVFPTAGLYENEMNELFGVRIKFAAPDHHRMFRITEQTPFK